MSKKIDPHAPHIKVTRYGFTFNGVNFSRVGVGQKGKITVYISSKKDSAYIHVTKGGKITFELYK